MQGGKRYHVQIRVSPGPRHLPSHISLGLRLCLRAFRIQSLQAQGASNLAACHKTCRAHCWLCNDLISNQPRRPGTGQAVTRTTEGKVYCQARGGASGPIAPESLLGLPSKEPKKVQSRGGLHYSHQSGRTGSPHQFAPQPNTAIVLEAWSLLLLIQLTGSV